MTEPTKTAVVVPAKTQMRMTAISFVNSVSFANSEYPNLYFANANQQGTVDTAVAARFEADGSVQPIGANQRSDGLLLTKKAKDRQKGVEVTYSSYVSWSNIRSISYAPIEK